MTDLPMRCRRSLLLLLSCFVAMAGAWAQPPSAPDEKQAASRKPDRPRQPKIDRSGKARKGEASYYARSFAGKKMADGTPMNPDSNVAASKTLPLGTTARVTNLENGRSAVVEIKDRGPYVDGRIVDLSPKVAKKLKMTEQGVAPVVVKPIEVPLPDGSVKPGAGAVPESEMARDGGGH